ncbi:MAG: hypothetical protein QW304_09240 [Thermoproteota archaeon]
MEAELLFTLEREGRAVFTLDEAMEILNCSGGVLRKILYRLTMKGRIQRIKRGYYILVPARAGYETSWTEHVFSFINKIIDEYYVGYWTALNYWQMTEQIPRTIFIATGKRRRDFSYNNTPIHFITVSPQKFFGWTVEKIGDVEFRISDREKTILDSLDMLHYAGGISEVAKGLRSNLDWEKMIRYAKNLQNNTVSKRLGYLIELLELKVDETILEQLRGSIRPSYSWLDPTAPKTILKTDSKWRLKINVQPEYIRSDKLDR